MKTGVKYTIEIAEMLVSVRGRALIVEYLPTHGAPLSPLRSREWTWEWITQRGPYRGKLPKRLSRMMKARYNIVLTPEQVSEIGNIAKEHILPPVIYILDFNDGLNWNAGDFGDHGSCFWTCHALARDELREQGVLAIRLYDGEAKGYARAWIYKISDDTWILFNAYGTTTRQMANIFATFLSHETSQLWIYNDIDLFVGGDEYGLIYLNSSPQVVHIEGIAQPEGIDLEWNIGDYLLCYYCEAYVRLGTEYHYRGDSYCYDCLEKVAIYCSVCMEIIDCEDEEYEHDGDTLCLCCYNDRQEEEM